MTGQSTRRIDGDGRLHVAYNRITKAAVNPYLGAEIPNWRDLGLDASKIYRLLRDPEELKSETTLRSANNVQLLAKHVAVNAQDTQKENVIGTTGTDAKWEPPYITNSLAIWDEAAIAAIESGDQCELSCSYRYVPVMEMGTYDGQSYDGRMTKIEFNHVALVEQGRAGRDVLVGDQLSEGPIIMPIFKKAALRRAAADFSAQAEKLKPLMAADAALKPLYKSYVRFAADAAKAADKAKDEEEMEADDEVMDPEEMAGEDESDEEEDDRDEEEKAEKLRKSKITKVPPGDKTAKDAKADGEDPAAAKEDDDEGAAKNKKAMDSLTAAFRERFAAEKLVRPLVGELDALAFDSAAEIFRFALKSQGVDAKGANVEGLRLAVDMALKSRKTSLVPSGFAHDSAGISPFLKNTISAKRG